MTCEFLSLPGGGRAFVCGPTKRCICGEKATLECDWKVQGKKSGTCDKRLCGRCTFSPRAGKDLCPEHKTAFEQWLVSRSVP